MAQTDAQGGGRNPLLIGVIVVVLVAAVVIYFRSAARETTEAVTRKTFDFVVTWRCLECGQTQRDNAGVGPLQCPKCNKDAMYASLRWNCPQHGNLDLAFQYDDKGDPTKYKAEGQDWQPAFEASGGWNLKCPKCNAVLNPEKSPAGRPGPPTTGPEEGP